MMVDVVSYSPTLTSKLRLFDLLFEANQCLLEKDYTRVCRILEFVLEASRKQSSEADIDWFSDEIQSVLRSCTRDLASAYIALKLHKYAVPLLENAIWNNVIENTFFIDARLLIESYLILEEFWLAEDVATVVFQLLPQHKFDDKEDEIKINLTLIAAFEKSKQPCHEAIETLADKVIAMTRLRDSNERWRWRIKAFLAKSTASLRNNDLLKASVSADQALTLSMSTKVVIDPNLVIQAKVLIGEIKLLQNHYAEAVQLLNEAEQFNRSAASKIERLNLARTMYLISECYLKLEQANNDSHREECVKYLQKAAKMSLGASSTQDVMLLLVIWEQLAEIYSVHPSFVQMEHGHKCIHQLLSNQMHKLANIVEACEPIPPMTAEIISKSCRLYLELECALTDAKMAIETVEMARNGILLSKIPCRRLTEKLSRPFNMSWLESVVSRFGEKSLFFYFADIGKGNSRALCLWVISSNQGILFFNKFPACSVRSGKTLEELIRQYVLLNHPHLGYTSETRLLPASVLNLATYQSSQNADKQTILLDIGEILFSRLPPSLWKECSTAFIFPDGQLLALSCFYPEVVHNWIKYYVPDCHQLPVVLSLPSILFLEIVYENQTTSRSVENEHEESLKLSKLGGMFSFFDEERRKRNGKPCINRNAQNRRSIEDDHGTKPLARPLSAKLACGAHTIATLTTKSWSGADVCTSSLYALSSANNKTPANNVVFFANPELSGGAFNINGSAWQPPILEKSQKEAIVLSKQLNSPWLYLGHRCTKHSFLNAWPDVSILHLATYVSYVDGVIAFSLTPEIDTKLRGNPFTCREVSGFKLIPSEIASLPVRKAKLVSISACPSATQLLRMTEFAHNHIGNSTYVLPAAFLLAGAQRVVVPRVGLSDDQLLDGFCKLYSTSESIALDNYFYSTIGIRPALDFSRLAHNMLDQQVRNSITMSQQEAAIMDGRRIFIDESITESSWGSTMQRFVGWIFRRRPSREDLGILRQVLQNSPKVNEQSDIPQSVELLKFLTWFGYHVVALDGEAKTVFSPLDHVTQVRHIPKALLLLEAIDNLMFEDFVLCDAAVDLLENLCSEQISDLVSLFTLVKHTTVAIQVKDQTPYRLFDNPRIRSFLSRIGFCNVRGTVIFRASPENGSRFETVFKLLISLSFEASAENLFRFVPASDLPTSPELVATTDKLKSLNYSVAKGPNLSDQKPQHRRIVALEPTYHISDKSLSKTEIDAKVNLAFEMKNVHIKAAEKLRQSKNVFYQQLEEFEKLSSVINQREASKLPNRVVSDRVKVEPGGTPSQRRLPVNHFPSIQPSVINEQRGKLKQFFNVASVSIKDDKRKSIEKLIEKYTESGSVTEKAKPVSNA